MVQKPLEKETSSLSQERLTCSLLPPRGNEPSVDSFNAKMTQKLNLKRDQIEQEF